MHVPLTPRRPLRSTNAVRRDAVETGADCRVSDAHGRRIAGLYVGRAAGPAVFAAPAAAPGKYGYDHRAHCCGGALALHASDDGTVGGGHDDGVTCLRSPRPSPDAL